MKELKNAYGTASPNHISLDNKADYHQSFGSSFSNISLHTITHEISHILSGQRVEASPKYFEEEYRVIWEFMEPLLPETKKKYTTGRPRLKLRHVVDGIFYVLRTGCLQVFVIKYSSD